MAKENESEKAIEKYCQKVAKDYGGVAVKFSSPSNRGVPDRMLLMPGGRVAFLELKSTGKKQKGCERVYYIHCKMAQ